MHPFVDLLSDALTSYKALNQMSVSSKTEVLKAQGNIVDHLLTVVLEQAPEQRVFSSNHSIFIALSQVRLDWATRWANVHQEKIWEATIQEVFPLLDFLKAIPVTKVWPLSKKERQNWGELVLEGLSHAMPLRNGEIPEENLSSWKSDKSTKKKLAAQSTLIEWLAESECPDPWIKNFAQRFAQQEGAWVFESEKLFAEMIKKEFLERSVKAMNPASLVINLNGSTQTLPSNLVSWYVQSLKDPPEYDALPYAETLIKKAKLQNMEVLNQVHALEDVKAAQAYFLLQKQDETPRSRQKVWEEFLEQLEKTHRFGVNAIMPTQEVAWHEAIAENGNWLAQALISPHADKMDWHAKNCEGSNIWSAVASAVVRGWNPDFSVMRLAKRSADIQLPSEWTGVYWDRPNAGEIAFYEKTSNVGLFPFWFGSLQSQRSAAEYYCHSFFYTTLSNQNKNLMSFEALGKLSQSPLLEKMASEIQWMCWMCHDYVQLNPNLKKTSEWERFKVAPSVIRPSALSVRWMSSVKNKLKEAIPHLSEENRQKIVSMFDKQTLSQSQPKKTKSPLSLPGRRL